MNQYILLIFGSFLISMLCGFLVIPQILKLCRNYNLYDWPNARKTHEGGIPRLGGICFMPNMFIAFILTLFIFNYTSTEKQVTLSLWSCYFFISVLLIYCTGIIDDLVGLKPGIKFLIQIIGAGLLPIAGLYINNLYGFLGIYEIPFWIGGPLTVFVIVFINNAINLIDGIDGLSGTLSMIALLGFLFCFLKEGIWTYCFLIVGLMGVLAAFLYFNMFGKSEKGTKIFMGDSGSLTLGFILGFLLVKFSMDAPDIMPYRRNSLLLSYTLLIVPIFDVFRIIFVRTMHRKPIFKADKNHIHHKIMRAGFTQHQTLFIITTLALFYIISNLYVSNYMFFSYIIVIDIFIWIAFNFTINLIINKKGRKIFFTEADK